MVTLLVVGGLALASCSSAGGRTAGTGGHTAASVPATSTTQASKPANTTSDSSKAVRLRLSDLTTLAGTVWSNQRPQNGWNTYTGLLAEAKMSVASGTLSSCVADNKCLTELKVQPVTDPPGSPVAVACSTSPSTTCNGIDLFMVGDGGKVCFGLQQADRSVRGAVEGTNSAPYMGSWVITPSTPCDFAGAKQAVSTTQAGTRGWKPPSFIS